MNIRKSFSAMRRYSFIAMSMYVLLLLSAAVFAQTTISTGSIQGTITDPSGAVVSSARVTIRNRDTAKTAETTTSSSGTFASGALIPGNYVVRVQATGFRTLEMPVTVQVIPRLR